MRIQCPECGFSREIKESAVPADSCFATCPKCSFRFRFRGEETDEDPDKTAEQMDDTEDIWSQNQKEEKPSRSASRRAIPLFSSEGSVPWECSGGFLRPSGFGHTLMMLLKNRSAFFSGIDPFSSILPAWIFLLLCHIPFIADIVFQVHQISQGSQEIANLTDMAGFTQIILTPLVLITLHQFLSSGIIYLTLRVIAPEEAVFRRVFKIFAYSRTPMILVIMPYVGFWLAGVLAIAFLILGLRYAHRLTWSKTVMAVLPFLLISFCTAFYFFRMMAELNNLPL